MNLTHFGSCFETIHDVSATQLEVLVTCANNGYALAQTRLQEEI